MIQKIKYIFILIFLLKSYNCIAQDNESLALVNAKIVTVDSTLPEAQALWITGDRISVVGSNNEIAKYISRNTQVIDLKGKLVVPGFIDGHAHFLGLGYAKMNLDLTKVKNWTEVIGIVKEAVKNAEDIITS